MNPETIPEVGSPPLALLIVALSATLSAGVFLVVIVSILRQNRPSRRGTYRKKVSRTMGQKTK